METAPKVPLNPIEQPVDDTLELPVQPQVEAVPAQEAPAPPAPAQKRTRKHTQERTDTTFLVNDADHELPLEGLARIVKDRAKSGGVRTTYTRRSKGKGLLHPNRFISKTKSYASEASHEEAMQRVRLERGDIGLAYDRLLAGYELRKTPAPTAEERKAGKKDVRPDVASGVAKVPDEASIAGLQWRGPNGVRYRVKHADITSLPDPENWNGGKWNGKWVVEVVSPTRKLDQKNPKNNEDIMSDVELLAKFGAHLDKEPLKDANGEPIKEDPKLEKKFAFLDKPTEPSPRDEEFLKRQKAQLQAQQAEQQMAAHQLGTLQRIADRLDQVAQNGTTTAEAATNKPLSEEAAYVRVIQALRDGGNNASIETALESLGTIDDSLRDSLISDLTELSLIDYEGNVGASDEDLRKDQEKELTSALKYGMDLTGTRFTTKSGTAVQIAKQYTDPTGTVLYDFAAEGTKDLNTAYNAKQLAEFLELTPRSRGTAEPTAPEPTTPEASTSQMSDDEYQQRYIGALRELRAVLDLPRIQKGGVTLDPSDLKENFANDAERIKEAYKALVDAGLVQEETHELTATSEKLLDEQVYAAIEFLERGNTYTTPDGSELTVTDLQTGEVQMIDARGVKSLWKNVTAEQLAEFLKKN